MGIWTYFISVLGILATGVVSVPLAGGDPSAPSEQITRRHRQQSTSQSTTRKTDRVLGVPIINPDARNLVANSYIVVYKSNATDIAVNTHISQVMGKVTKRNLERRSQKAATNGTEDCNDTDTASDAIQVDTSVRTFHMGAWRAMSLRAAEDRTMMEIFDAAEVAYIEQDAYVSISALTTQTNAPSGLVRLSHADAGGTSYVFDDSAGQGITAFVVDTGIRVTHSEFQGRAEFGANFVNSVDTDENGHGSHVAGTIGGQTFGVAKNVSLVAVKVLDADGSGTNSGVIAGMNWVASNATSRGLAGKAVMNMSLGGSRSRAVNAAISNIRNAGVIPVVAAGNENQDASNSSPASAVDAIAVGAIDQSTDAKASFSNFGPSVAIFAPGVSVQSVGISNDTASAILSGTSMASPHVAGLAAYLMAHENLTDASDILSRMQQLAQATGAEVSGNSRRTTDLIANNGNQ